MRIQDQQEKLSELLHGDLSSEEEEQIIAGLEKSGISRKEIEAMRSVGGLIEKIPVPEPSAGMDQRFYMMLGEEKKKILQPEQENGANRSPGSSFVNTGLKIAAGIVLFLLGWFASGRFGSSPAINRQIAGLAGEVKQMKETLVLTMMQQSSSVERIRAVSMASEFEDADRRIIEALVGVLNHDSNDNVRLLALEALVRYSSIPEVREGLVASIGNQKSPLVQLRITEIMLALNEKRAAPEFQKMLQDASLNYSVRGKMNEALGVLL